MASILVHSSSRLASEPRLLLTRHEPTDGEVAAVVARARTGAPAAIARLYEWYAADLLRLTARLMASRDDAEDVVHDVFVGLPEQLARYDERGRLQAWLRVTAIGVARMRLRREWRRSNVLAREQAVDSRPPAADLHLTLDVERAVDALPESLRLVFVLKQWEGYSHDEIAQLLSISAGASRVRHSRALDALRSLLDR